MDKTYFYQGLHNFPWQGSKTRLVGVRPLRRYAQPPEVTGNGSMSPDAADSAAR